MSFYPLPSKKNLRLCFVRGKRREKYKKRERKNKRKEEENKCFECKWDEKWKKVDVFILLSF